MTLTKNLLAENLFEMLGINKREAKDLVELFFSEISLLLEQGHTVYLFGFGKFHLYDKKERPGRNPRTGQYVAITPRRVVTFRSGQKLKARIEKYARST